MRERWVLDLRRVGGWVKPGKGESMYKAVQRFRNENEHDFLARAAQPRGWRYRLEDAIADTGKLRLTGAKWVAVLERCNGDLRVLLEYGPRGMVGPLHAERLRKLGLR